MKKKEDELNGACSTHGKVNNACNSTVEKFGGPHGIPRGKWGKSNIKMGLKESDF
jgi:hypothetical protein